MRTTKAMIYAGYGIQYDTKRQKIYSPLRGWIKPLLVNGNDKLGKGVWNWSMLPGDGDFTVNMGTKANPDWETFHGTCPCNCPGCYAQGGCYCFNSTRASLARKTELAAKDLDFLKRAILAQIEADGIKILRVHVAGDFFSLDYVDMWREIARAKPDVVMWSYTKNADAVHAFDDIANFNMVKSVIPGKGINYGHIDYVIACYEYLVSQGKRVYICRCGIDVNQHCSDCHGCSTNDYVLFVEHGTGYNAEEDPLYPVLVALIEGQASQKAA